MPHPPCRPSAETAQRLITLHHGHGRQHSGLTVTQRVAVCITGLISSGKQDEADFRRGWSVSDRRSYEAWRTWADELATHQVTVDFFMWIDMRTIKPRLQGAEGWTPFGTPGFEPLGTPECNSSGPRVQAGILTGAISALRPVVVHTSVEPCYCARQSCECLPPDVGLSFVEQMAKVRSCYDGVAKHERASGRPYDFLLKARSDYDLARNGVTALALHLAVSREGPERIFTHPWIEPAFGNVDWLFLAPRRLARAAFSFERGATCQWLRCVRARLESTIAGKAWREGVLALWWLSNELPFEALLTDSATYHNKSQNGICVFQSQDRGLLTTNTAADLLALGGECSTGQGSGSRGTL